MAFIGFSGGEKGLNINLTIRTLIFHLLRIGFGILLIYSAIQKLGDPFSFSGIVKNYDVFGWGVSRLVAIAFPPLELLVGMILITTFWLDTGLMLLYGMTSVFLLITAQALLRGLDISCGCFNLEGDPIGLVKLGENLTFFALSWWLFMTGKRRYRSE